MSSELELLKQCITELEAENAELRKENTEIHDLRFKLTVSNAEVAELKRKNTETLKSNAEYNERRDAENAKLKARIEELKKNKQDSSAENVRRDVEIAEIKAEVVKLRDNNEESKQLTSRQSDVTSKEMISGYNENTIDEIESQSSVSSNTINLVSNVYEMTDVSDHALVSSDKSSEEKETVAFLNEEHKKRIKINSSTEEKHILPTVTEISANLVHPNSLAERNEERAVLPDIINLYETACGAEKKAIEVNREETLRWCFYAREFKRMYKDFMVSNKVGEKKAKGQVYDFIIKQLLNTKRKTLCRQTQKALRIDDLFEKIGMDKLQYIKTYSTDTISKFTDLQIQTIIDHFTEKPNMEFTDETEDEEQDDEVPEGFDQNNVLEILPPKESTTPIPLSHDSNSSGGSSKIGPVNSPKSQANVTSTTSQTWIPKTNPNKMECLYQYAVEHSLNPEKFSIVTEAEKYRWNVKCFHSDLERDILIYHRSIEKNEDRKKYHTLLTDRERIIGEELLRRGILESRKSTAWLDNLMKE
ncbi:hypothetical protein GLOIN_2v1649975 [Rhizophagus clarus]|uniref:Uncharacterized protein n=1 Tax=Rhizophagus clarus TaxID=94130 RepID=A0A8H3L021_9GLOM|nr:hypothetical protein GLOIN_2v1649975 [Rhizophagus clarus]